MRRSAEDKAWRGSRSGHVLGWRGSREAHAEPKPLNPGLPIGAPLELLAIRRRPAQPARPRLWTRHALSWTAESDIHLAVSYLMFAGPTMAVPYSRLVQLQYR